MEDKEEEVGVDDGFALVYSVTYASTIQEVLILFQRTTVRVLQTSLWAR